MASTFPDTNDSNLGVPPDPAGVALSKGATGGRVHTDHHEILGEAVIAIQQNVPILTHDHSGTEARPTSRLKQINTHQDPDTDDSATSLHHTLGKSATQAAPGNHRHHSSEITGLGYYLIKKGESRPLNPPLGTKIYEAETNRVYVWAKIHPMPLGWRLTTEGSVPYLRAKQTRRQVIPSGRNGTMIEWHQKTDGEFDILNPSRSLTNLYAPEDGVYHIEYSVAYDRDWLANASGTGLRLNGGLPPDPTDRWEYTRGQIFGIVQNVDNQADVRLKKGEYVTVWARHNALFNEFTERPSPQSSRVTMRYVGM